VVGDLRNLTGQSVLDDSLEQAFRISLEQSRYVNVLSDLKARDTLDRMQRKPDTVLDRAVASEIALRDGARAVILPTVAEVGGRVRVSAEVIDPHTQTTVYAESADGSGVSSALGSIDTVTAALREKLGEAMKSIDRDSEPLPKVATDNLDALRAYALGVKSYAGNRYPEAMQYFNRAIEVDPKFALAYMGALRVQLGAVDSRAGRGSLDKAIALRGHLPPRDALYLDAWVAEFGPKPTQVAPQKWKLLASLYPDYYGGHFNYAWGAFLSNDYREAMRSAKIAAAPQNPLRGTALELVGRVQLAQEQYKEALASFVQAETAGRYGPNRRRAAALAAMGRFEEAQAVLDKLTAGHLLTADVTNEFEKISVLVDQRRWQEALQAAAQAKAIASGSTPLLANEFRLIEASVVMLHRPRQVDMKSLEAILLDSLQAARDTQYRDRNIQIYLASAAAYIAQRSGDHELAARALPELTALTEQIGDPSANQMLAIVRAGQLRLAGKPDEAVALLRPLLTGSELFQVHVALRDAFTAAGREKDAAGETAWLRNHRGRAYAEGAGDLSLQAVNVADTHAGDEQAGEQPATKPAAAQPVAS
jgi:putative peptide modification system cyclase